MCHTLHYSIYSGFLESHILYFFQIIFFFCIWADLLWLSGHCHCPPSTSVPGYKSPTSQSQTKSGLHSIQSSYFVFPNSIPQCYAFNMACAPCTCLAAVLSPGLQGGHKPGKSMRAAKLRFAYRHFKRSWIVKAPSSSPLLA